MKEGSQTSKKRSDLPFRWLINGLSAIVIAIFLFFAEFIYFRWIFVSGIAAIAGVALWEYYQLLRKKELLPATILGIVGGVLYVYSIFFKVLYASPQSTISSFAQNAPSIILGISFFSCFVFYARRIKSSPIPSPIINIATTFMGIVYIAIPLALVVRIVYFFQYGGAIDPLFEGSWWVLYLVATTKSADMGGYFIGRSFGKRKLALRLSPNKTLEGALGGLVAATLMSIFVCYLGSWVGGVFSDFSYLEAFWLGVLMGAFGQMGDLAESLLKRDARVKDSNVLPGVGGILDMVDSLLFTAPLVYLFLKIHYLG